MSLNSNKIKGGSTGKKYPNVDAGTYPSRTVQIIDLGLQAQRPYQGQEKPPTNEVMLTYELLDEFLPDEDGNEDRTKPRWYSEIIPIHNLKADKAKSTKRYYALDPNEEHEGDFSKLVDIPCMLTLVHNENKKDPDNPYVNIASVSSMRPKEAAKAPPLVNKAKTFDLDDPDLDIFDSLPDWLQQKIKENLNYGGSLLERMLKDRKAAPKKEEAPKKAAKKAAPVEEEAPEEDEDSPW